MKNFIKRVFKRENTFGILVIIGGLLSFSDLKNKIGITPDQVVLALLILLAVDTLSERLGYLDRIEGYAAKIEQKIKFQTSVDNIFHSNEALPAFDSLLQQGDEMWISGKNLYGFLTHYWGAIQTAATRGKRFRFLIVDPDNHELMCALSASSFLYPLISDIKAIGTNAVDFLTNKVGPFTNGTIEVKLAKCVPTNSYLIVDGEKAQGQMIVEMYGYKIPRSDRFHLHLTHAEDPKAFHFCLEQFKSMWKEAASLSSAPQKSL